MKHLLIALALVLFSLPALAANRYVAATGDWDDVGTWNDDGCGQAADASVAPTAADAVFLCPNVTVTVPCNYDAVLLSLADSGTWTSSTTGGLIADGSACADGEVPTFTFSQTSNVGAARLTSMGAGSTYRLKGRSIITDSPWGEPSDLTQNCGGADQTITANDGASTGIVFATATLDCSLFTWANLPYSASKPTLTNLSKGDMIWFTTGAYRNNFIHVVASAANTLTVGFGDPGSTYGGGNAGWDGPAQLPTIGGNGNKRSLENYIDVDMTAVDQTVPNRILVSIQTGALSTIPTGSNATGQRAGQCLITSTQTATAGSGTYYRIAGSVDGGAGTDTLILDPWTEMAAADTNATFLATASNAWVGPCVRPGDRWYAFEPLVQKPATAGTHYNSTLWVAGACPDIQRVWWPMATPAADGAGAWADITNPVAGFYGQSACTIQGPWAIGPFRHAGTAGYGIESKASNRFTISNVSMQGSYHTVAQNWRIHGFTWIDVQDLVLDRVNVSFVNNEGVYHHTAAEETSESDSTFEGATVTLSNSTIHDLFDAVSSSDNGGGATFQVTQTVGTHRFTMRDNLIWNVELVGFAANPSSTLYPTIDIHSNVIGPTHRIDEADSTTRAAVYCALAYPNINVVNNVLLTDIDYNNATAGSTIQARDCGTVVYNYIGEAHTAVSQGGTANAQVAAVTVVGNLVEGAGADASGALTSSSFLRGVDTNRSGSTWVGPFTMKHNWFRRFCPLSTAYTAALNLLGSASSAQLDISITNNSLGLYCPTITGVGVSPTAGTGGLVFQNNTAIANLVTGSDVKRNLFITGDTLHDGGADNYEIYPIICNAAATTAPSLTFGENVCSECNGASSCQDTCARNCPTATLGSVTHEANSVDTSLLSPVRRMESTGIRSITDMRLRRESPAFALDETDHAGSAYAGILSYRQAMEDAGVPREFIEARAFDNSQPTTTYIPAHLRTLVSGSGGRGFSGPNIR